MSTATPEKTFDNQGQNAELRGQLAHLQAENARLRDDNRRLRAALDAHLGRASSTTLFGPLEMTAGTCVGPHRS
jgi:hypothetical protein